VVRIIGERGKRRKSRGGVREGRGFSQDGRIFHGESTGGERGIFQQRGERGVGKEGEARGMLERDSRLSTGRKAAYLRRIPASAGNISTAAAGDFNRSFHKVLKTAGNAPQSPFLAASPPGQGGFAPCGHMAAVPPRCRSKAPAGCRAEPCAGLGAAAPIALTANLPPGGFARRGSKGELAPPGGVSLNCDRSWKGRCYYSVVGRNRKRIRAAAEGPARPAVLPPRTPPTAAQGALPPEIPLLIGLQPYFEASINAVRGDRACGRELSAVLDSQRWDSSFFSEIDSQLRLCEHSRIGFRNERAAAARGIAVE